MSVRTGDSPAGSRLGAVLDMVTDRAGTTILITGLAILYPTFAPLWCLVTFVDICSHWSHMYNSLLQGEQSHKECTSPILRWYYSRWVLFTLCLANEATFVMWYIRAWAYTEPYDWIVAAAPALGWLLDALLLVATPLCVVKNLINIVQWIEAAQHLVAFEVAHR